VLFTPTTTGAEVVQEIAYYPYGMVISDLSYLPLTSTNRYRREGKEYISDHGWNKYDFHWRAFCSMTGRSLQPDRMAEKFPWLSPYSLFAGNPIKFIDPDGRVIRLANNYAGGMENIARIAATSLGSQVMSHLINRREVYTLSSTFWTGSSGYNPRSGYIYYVGNPWHSQIPRDGGALNSMIAMGHETFHALDHSMGVFSSSNYRRDITEPRAVSFENYLREAHSLSPFRDGYGNIKGDFHQFSANEKISDFTTLGNNSDKTSYGFSYTKTTTIVESYKTGFLGRKIPDKTRTETSTHYMTVSRDGRNNVSFQTYDDEESYRKATSNW
jgi:RHS repeat-associated protein